MKKVLFVASPYMGLFKDIQRGLMDLGFSVEMIIQKSFPNNPYSVLHKKTSESRINEFQTVLLDYWRGLLEGRPDDSLFFDYLLVINGLSIHPYLFEKLKEVNKEIKLYNYIYDRIKGVYQIDGNFKYYDDIYTFDCGNVEEYNLKLLPIFWVPVTDKLSMVYDVFAFGGIDPIRADVFKRIKALSDKTKLCSFIKIYHSEVKDPILYSLRRIAKYVLQGRKSPSLKELRSELYTRESMDTDLFRTYINSSRVTIDTNHPYQDGLTARFMWALGAGKKIITNNKNVERYDFYTKEQILILDDTVTDQDIIEFIQSENDIPRNTSILVEKYRIDNWLKTVLNLKEIDYRW